MTSYNSKTQETLCKYYIRREVLKLVPLKGLLKAIILDVREKDRQPQ
ncbi:hypothetical protein HYT23_01080 [Candidatus Pacearchaeota archaeon]|nr:hypothetical protein [Candidatus Pacearchaeota archaeon]